MKRKLVIIALVLSALTILIGLTGALAFDRYLTAIPYLYFGVLCFTVTSLYNLLRFVQRVKQMFGFMAITLLFLIFLIGWFYTPLLKDNGIYYTLLLIALVWWLFIEVYVPSGTFFKKYAYITAGIVFLVLGVSMNLEAMFYGAYLIMTVELITMLIRVNRVKA